MAIITEARLQVALQELANALDDASKTNEYHQDTGDSNRLLRSASALASTLVMRGTTDHDVCVHMTYDIAAFIKSAMRVPGDLPSEQRRELLHQATTLIVEITGDPEAMDLQVLREPTDEEIDQIANGMPGGLDGFLKHWGWRQFGRAVLQAFGKDKEIGHVH